MEIKESKGYETADKLIEESVEMIMDDTEKKINQLGNLIEKEKNSPSNLSTQQQLHLVLLVKGFIAQDVAIVQSEIKWLIRSKVDSLDVLKIMRLANELSFPFVLKS